MARQEQLLPFAREVVDVPVSDEMSESFLAYSLSVITARAIPDVRDGLKPVQRRILYSMLDMGLRPNTPHRKCARVVGDTMGKYHPHGDMAIYEALVRMGQDFSRGITLVDPHGNFGSLDDPPAAPRYTECRLTEAAMEMLRRARAKTPSTSNPPTTARATEPEYLPAPPAQPARQRHQRHRRGHGHQHGQPQPRRGLRAAIDPRDEQAPAETHCRRTNGRAAGARLPRRRHRRRRRASARPTRPAAVRSGCAPGPRSSRSRPQSPGASSVTELPPTWSAPRRSSASGSRNWCVDNKARRHQSTSRTSPTASRACASRSNAQGGHQRPRPSCGELYRLTPLEETFAINNVVLVEGVPPTTVVAL